MPKQVAEVRTEHEVSRIHRTSGIACSCCGRNVANAIYAIHAANSAGFDVDESPVCADCIADAIEVRDRAREELAGHKRTLRDAEQMAAELEEETRYGNNAKRTQAFCHAESLVAEVAARLNVLNRIIDGEE